MLLKKVIIYMLINAVILKCREFKMRHVIKYVENVDKNNEDNKLYNELYKEIRKFK